jgi:hypothetical protein
MIPGSILLDEWKRILSAQGVPSEEQDRVTVYLERAFIANMLARLVKELSPQQLAEFTTNDTRQPEQMISCLVSSCPPIRLKELLQLASEEVLTQYAESI